MISRTLRERASRENMRADEKQRGIPANHLRMNSQRVAETLIPTLNKLPCVISDQVLQNADGSFVFLAGYSSATGPDA